jgi:hypothetical protein
MFFEIGYVLTLGIEDLKGLAAEWQVPEEKLVK